jgi:cell division protein FtsB
VHGQARHTKHHSTRRALRAALYLTLSVFALVLLFGWLYTTALRARLESQGTRLAAQEGALAQARAEVAALRAEREALATGRLPGLTPLEYDRAFQIDRGYVRNVIFTATGTSGAQRYEYRLVVENPGTTMLQPAVRLLFFDDAGIQVGESVLGRDATSTPGGAGAWVEPGETRSYTGLVALAREATPRYFLVVVE